jgi:hypothetical protein
MTFPLNPQDQDQYELNGQIYIWNQAKTAWQKLLNQTPENIDATTLDGLDSGQFLRRDQSQTMTGDLSVSGTVSSNTGFTSIAQSELYDLTVTNDLILNGNFLVPDDTLSVPTVSATAINTTEINTTTIDADQLVITTDINSPVVNISSNLKTPQINVVNSSDVTQLSIVGDALSTTLTGATVNLAATTLTLGVSSTGSVTVPSSIVNIGTGNTTGRVTVNNTASNTTTSTSNALLVNGGIWAQGGVRAVGGFVGSLTGTASTATNATNATRAVTLGGGVVNQYQFSVFMDPVSFPSNSNFQQTVTFSFFGSQYLRYEVEAVGLYYTPTSSPTLTNRFYKKSVFAVNGLPVTPAIEGNTNIYAFNTDATNFAAGTSATTGKVFFTIVSGSLVLNMQQRTTPAADSFTSITVLITEQYA